jgi:transposase
MLTLNHRYRIYPNASQEQRLFERIEICRTAYNYALREIKDWCDSRNCSINKCSVKKEYILPADLKFPNEINQLNNLPGAKKEFPELSEVPSQVLQQAIKQLHRAWQYFQQRGFGFRVHLCPNCNYKTDRDVASGQVIRNRGIKLVSTVGQTGIESACADDLPEVGENQSRQVSQPRKGTTRKSKK